MAQQLQLLRQRVSDYEALLARELKTGRLNAESLVEPMADLNSRLEHTQLQGADLNLALDAVVAFKNKWEQAICAQSRRRGTCAGCYGVLRLYGNN